MTTKRIRALWLNEQGLAWIRQVAGQQGKRYLRLTRCTRFARRLACGLHGRFHVVGGLHSTIVACLSA